MFEYDDFFIFDLKIFNKVLKTYNHAPMNAPEMYTDKSSEEARVNSDEQGRGVGRNNRDGVPNSPKCTNVRYSLGGVDEEEQRSLPEGRHRWWSVTIWDLTSEEVLRICESTTRPAMDGWGFQDEVSPTTGRPHVQATLGFKGAVMAIRLVRMFGRCHVSVTDKVTASLNYCKKEETRAPGKEPIEKKVFVPDVVIDEMDDLVPFPWQQEIIDMVSVKAKPGDRTIYWYWCKNGNSGKTTLAKHIHLLHKDVTLAVNGNAKDIKCAAAKFLEGHNLHICMFTFPRTVENYVSYAALEDMKDGFFFSGKYESGMVHINPPHVICFANFEPKKKGISNHKWKIIEIKASSPAAEPPPFGVVDNEKEVDITPAMMMDGQVDMVINF